MAIRFDGGSDKLSRTSDLINYNQPYTSMGWFKLVVDMNARTLFIGLDAGSSSNRDQLRTSSDGTTAQIAVSSAGTSLEESGSALSLDTWYHLAMRRTDTTVLEMYINGTLNKSVTLDVSSRTAATQMSVGAYLTNSYPFNGTAFALKAWTVALTAQEIQQEMECIAPRRFENLYAFWPMLMNGNGVRNLDFSGNGRHWTENGTLTDELPPPVCWGSQPLIAQFVEAAAAAFFFGRVRQQTYLRM